MTGSRLCSVVICSTPSIRGGQLKLKLSNTGGPNALNTSFPSTNAFSLPTFPPLFFQLRYDSYWSDAAFIASCIVSFCLPGTRTARSLENASRNLAFPSQIESRSESERSGSGPDPVSAEECLRRSEVSSESPCSLLVALTFIRTLL